MAKMGVAYAVAVVAAYAGAILVDVVGLAVAVDG